jgi:tRNA uridine 5-carboxymethylaminomethyl modification enzyme
LLLRHDNADTRLTQLGYDAGLVREAHMQSFLLRQARQRECLALLHQLSIKPSANIQLFLTQKGHGTLHGGITAYELLKRPNISLRELFPFFPQLADYESYLDDLYETEVEIKFAGYIDKESKKAIEFARFEHVYIPNSIVYEHLDGMAMEARQKLASIRPSTIGQAARISGVNPSDIALLVMQLKKYGVQRPV